MPAQAATLADLFAKARLSLNIPASPSTSRSVVFFDEVLNVEATLTLPADHLLPIASTSTHDSAFQYPLPLPAQPSRAQLGFEDIPPHLVALLACLHVNLSTDYVPPSSPSAHSTSKSTNPYEPLATIPTRFQHLQLLPSHNPHPDLAQTQHAAVRAFSNSWAGNQPPKPHRTLKDTADPQSSTSKSSHHAHVTHDAQHWSVHWYCRVPLNFIATPFPPLLAVTAALTLRLNHALLEQYLPTTSSRTFVRSGFAHSLLAPLHEGPVYPDESPLQSQARATATTALGLDGPHGLGSYLAHLSKDVVGGNNTVVTPRSGASALDTIHRRRDSAFSADIASSGQSRKLNIKTDSNGDLGGGPSSADLTPSTSMQGTTQDQQSAGLQIYKRSTREVLPLRTGLNVRMRTLVTQHDPWLHRRPSPHLASAELESSRLVLSVELENPFESQSTMLVNNITIVIHDNPTDRQDGKHRVVAKPLQPMASTLPIALTRGSQHNVLYYVSVEFDQASHNRSDGRVTGSSSRNVTITVSGRPQGGEAEELLSDFDSQWNCALDLKPVLSDAAKKSHITDQPKAIAAQPRPTPAGPIAGNVQYAASSLRAAQFADRPMSATTNKVVEEARTPRPGQLGNGFPPAMAARFASSRHVSMPTSMLDASAAEEGFLQKAKERAANRDSQAQSTSNGFEIVSIQPWISTSATSVAVRGADGLVILSTVRRSGSASSSAADKSVEFVSSLGPDGSAIPAVASGAKVLHPASISPSAADERGVRVQTGDTIVVDLVLLCKSANSSIADVRFSWAPPLDLGAAEGGPPAKAARDSADVGMLVKGRLMDAESARLKSALVSAQAEIFNGLIPVEDHLQLEGQLHSGQSTKIALALKCLSPGYYSIPPLKVEFFSAGLGEEAVMLEDLGAIYVTPAAVL